MLKKSGEQHQPDQFRTEDAAFNALDDDDSSGSQSTTGESPSASETTPSTSGRSRAVTGTDATDIEQLYNMVADLQATVLKQKQLIAVQDRKTAQLQSSLMDMRRRQHPKIPALPPPQLLRRSTSTPEWDPSVSPFHRQISAIGDRRGLGMYDSRFHSTSSGATPKDFRVLPKRIILIRHAESEGNVDSMAYTCTPDPQVPLTNKGWEQARAAGEQLDKLLRDMHGDEDYSVFCYSSPYRRSTQTMAGILSALDASRVTGVQESVQLREQDFGNFQDVESKEREKEDRLKYGRFYYRFPHGESGADVYDRITIFEDHLIRDINAGRFQNNSTLVLVTHGLALRVFLMRWFNWSVEEFLRVYNPPNAAPLVLDCVLPEINENDPGQASVAAWVHTKALYKLSEEACSVIEGVEGSMCRSPFVPPGMRN